MEIRELKVEYKEYVDLPANRKIFYNIPGVPGIRWNSNKKRSDMHGNTTFYFQNSQDYVGGQMTVDVAGVLEIRKESPWMVVTIPTGVRYEISPVIFGKQIVYISYNENRGMYLPFKDFNNIVLYNDISYVLRTSSAEKNTYASVCSNFMEPICEKIYTEIVPENVPPVSPGRDPVSFPVRRRDRNRTHSQIHVIPEKSSVACDPLFDCDTYYAEDLTFEDIYDEDFTVTYYVEDLEREDMYDE